MTCAMICSNNYAEEALVNAFSYSSQQTLGPASNVLADKRAYKTWMTNGYFKVDSTNNTLVIRETLGIDLSAVIASGEYLTRTAFNTALKTALEAVGAATYTITVDSALRTVITSDLGGGATIFQIMTSNVLSTAAELLGLGSTDYIGASSYVADLARLHQNEWLKFDFGVATRIQAVIIAGRTDRTFGLSPTATITVQINETDTWDSPEFETTLSVTDFCAYVLDVDGLFDPRRFMRILFEDPDNQNGYIEISKIFAGELQEFVRASPTFGFSDTLQDLTVVLDSIGGVQIADRRPRYSEIQYTLNYMTNLDKEDMQDIYERYGQTRPLFFIFDDNETLGTQAERMVRLMRFTGPLTFVKQSSRIWNVGMRLREEL